MVIFVNRITCIQKTKGQYIKYSCNKKWRSKNATTLRQNINMRCDKQLKSLTRPDDNATFKQRPGELILHGSRKASWYTPRTSTRLLYSRFSLNQCSTPTHVRFYIYTLLTFFKASPIFWWKEKEKKGYYNFLLYSFGPCMFSQAWTRTENKIIKDTSFLHY